jgi:hypothetical protein
MEYDIAALLRPRCKVCSSSIREGIDLRLMGKELRDDGERYSYEQLLDYAEENGLKLSKAGLSRHRSDHLMPDVLHAIEAQRQVEAIAQATGQTLGMPTAFLNILVNKAMKALSEHEFDDSGRWLNTSVRAIEVLLKVQKAELVFSTAKLEEAKGTLRQNGVSEDTIRMVDELLGAR